MISGLSFLAWEWQFMHTSTGGIDAERDLSTPE
jgi:hypothetical protein